jgi:hypothetical protein
MSCRTVSAPALRCAFVLCVVLLFCFVYPRAQAGLQRGALIGTVSDATGAVVPAAQIDLSSPDNAIALKALSQGDGSFTIRNLDSGTYTVKVVAPGFAAYQNNSVAIAVGRVTHLDVRLAPYRASQQVTVEAQTAALDTTQSSPVTNIDRDRIEELPIPSRNYLSFTLLSPALASANPALAVFSPAVAESGFSAGGLRPSSNAIYIDGVDDDDEYTGLSRTELSPEAISDFQVVNHGYEDESGGAAGGSVDVETRSGASLQHGDAFLFVQNGALNGTPALELAPRKPDENRLRAGLSTGGAVKHSSLFYYLAGELEMARGEEAGDFSPHLAAAIDSAVATTGPLRGFRLQQGFFPTTNEETELSGRADRAFGGNSFMMRYALTNNRSVNDAFNSDDLTDLSSRGSAFYNDNSVNGSWTDTFSPRLFNELNFEVAQRRAVLRTNSTTGPGIVVAGIAELGTPGMGNTRRYETHIDIGDDVIAQKRKHLLQAGVAERHVALRTADLDGFAGLYVFPDLGALAAGQPDFYAQNFGDAGTNFAEWRSAAYVQDHRTPARSLAIDYGLRYEDNHLPSPLPQHAINLSPRVGFAWSHGKNWVVRGGFGTFYDRYLLATINRIEQLDGVRAKQQIAEGSAAAALYQSGVSFTAPLPGIAPSIWRARPGLKNPYAETASLGVERALPAQWTASAEYRFVHGVHMGRTANGNLTPPVLLTAANAPALGIPAPTAQQLGRFVFPQQRLNAAYDSINQFETESNSGYNGLTLTVNRQFTETFELMAGYTFSKTIDDASYDTEQPQNPYNLGGERALSLDDQRHRFVLSGLWVLGPDLDEPQDRAKASKPNPLLKAVYGLEFAPILTAGSGFSTNPLTGVDSNREHIYPFEARPLGFARNSLTLPPTVKFDLRVLKMVPIWRGHLDIVAESFNLPNRQNRELIDSVFGSGVAADPPFGQPIQNADARRIQFSLDFEY